MIFIKYLPKDVLLYRLWKSAKYINYLKNCNIRLTIKRANKDLRLMKINNRVMNLTTYYGKRLFIDLSGDYVDIIAYDVSNGRGLAKKIIDELKKEEMAKLIAIYLI